MKFHLENLFLEEKFTFTITNSHIILSCSGVHED